MDTYYGFRSEILEDPDRGQIMDKLRALQNRQFGEDDQLLLFFTGHGKFDDFVSKGYFVARGAGGAIDLTDLANIVSRLPCRHVLLGIDACYSGTIDRAIAMRGRGQRPQPRDYDARTAIVRRKLANTSRLLITSGGKFRTPDGESGSPFTAGILTALRRGYSSGDGLVTFDALRDALERVSPTPHTGELAGHEQGGFVFVTTENMTPEPNRNPPTKPPIRQPVITPARDVTLNVDPRNKLASPLEMIIGSHVRASGGETTLRNVRELDLTAHCVNQEGFTFQAYQARGTGNRRAGMVTASNGMGQQLRSTYATDGRRGTVMSQFTGQYVPRAMTPAEIAQYTRDPLVTPLLDYAERGYSVRQIDGRRIDGRSTYGLHITHPNGYDIRTYLDTETYLPVYEESRDPATGVLAQTTFMNYRNYSGIMVATEQYTEYSNGTSLESQLIGLRINPGLPPGFWTGQQ